MPIWSDSFEEDDGIEIENEDDNNKKNEENTLNSNAIDKPELNGLDLKALGLGALEQFGLGGLNLDALGDILPHILPQFQSTVDTLQNLFGSDVIENALVMFLEFIEEKVQQANNPTESSNICVQPKTIDMLVLKNPFHDHENVDDNFSILNIIQMLKSELSNLSKEQIDEQQQIPSEAIKDEL